MPGELEGILHTVSTPESHQSHRKPYEVQEQQPVCVEQLHEQQVIQQLAASLCGRMVASRFQGRDILIDAKNFQLCEILSFEKRVGTAWNAPGEFFHLRRIVSELWNKIAHWAFQSVYRGNWPAPVADITKFYSSSSKKDTRQGSIKLSVLLLVLVKTLSRWGLLWIMYRQAARSQTNGKYMEKIKLNSYWVPGCELDSTLPYTRHLQTSLLPENQIPWEPLICEFLDIWMQPLKSCFQESLSPMGPNPPVWPV